MDSPQQSSEPIPTKSKVDLPPVDDARSSLMEAIRNAGGSLKAPLRAVKQTNEDKQAAKSVSVYFIFEVQRCLIQCLKR